MEVTGLEYDSRRVERGFVFFAFAGSRADGRQFAQDALGRGAVAVVMRAGSSAGFHGRFGLKRSMAAVHWPQPLAIFNRHPDERVHFTGITGTNGKTTTGVSDRLHLH
jgi:UDP-N-acetylmuramoyl-L-alanyl-D-glutamate--2,6-diaminopimelate ligase